MKMQKQSGSKIATAIRINQYPARGSGLAFGFKSKDIVTYLVVPKFTVEAPVVLLLAPLRFHVSAATFFTLRLPKHQFFFCPAQHFHFDECHLLKIGNQNRVVIKQTVLDEGSAQNAN